jgi:hypothetical protein
MSSIGPAIKPVKCQTGQRSGDHLLRPNDLNQAEEVVIARDT